MNTVIHGARCAVGPEKTIEASIEVAAGRIRHIRNQSAPFTPSRLVSERIDLTGFLLMPGLINAHDHLHFALFPRLANPPYQNYVDWGEDIHCAFPEIIALHKAVPRNVRLRWGGIRNLLCGVTTVCHHDPLWPELQRDSFPIQVLQQYGWAHSPALGGDLLTARAATPDNCPFIIHACEGVDAIARIELWQLDRLGLLDAKVVLVHALALDRRGISLIRRREASIIICPSSNDLLFGRTPDFPAISGVQKLALGNDSPLTAVGDLLDEVRFATHACNISPQAAYGMVTEAAAVILRLLNAEGSITESGAADLIAVRDRGDSPAKTLQSLAAADVEFVMVHGRVQLASEAILERLPASAGRGLEPLCVDGITRWLRAPVARLIEQAEEVLGHGNVRLGGKPISVPEGAAVAHGY